MTVDKIKKLVVKYYTRDQYFYDIENAYNRLCELSDQEDIGVYFVISGNAFESFSDLDIDICYYDPDLQVNITLWWIRNFSVEWIADAIYNAIQKKEKIENILHSNKITEWN